MNRVGRGVPAEPARARRKCSASAGYLPLYGGEGLALSWVQLNSLPLPANRLVGDKLLWARPKISNAPYYPEGFECVTSVVGSKYAASSPVLPFTEGAITFVGGNLPEPFTNRVTLTASNTDLQRPARGVHAAAASTGQRPKEQALRLPRSQGEAA